MFKSLDCSSLITSTTLNDGDNRSYFNENQRNKSKLSISSDKASNKVLFSKNGKKNFFFLKIPLVKNYFASFIMYICHSICNKRDNKHLFSVPSNNFL